MKNETASLAFNDLARGGTSDKVYHLTLSPSGDGFTVTAQYGRRGSALATDNKTKNGPLPYDEAKAIFDRVLREKIGKGYIKSGAKAPAPQIEPPKGVGAALAEIKRRNAPAVDLRPQELLEEITEAHALALVVDESYLMQDKSDGHSRGVVKSEGAIFGLNKLGQRVPLPAELHEELSRIELSTFQIDAELVGDRLIARDLLDAGGDIHAAPYEQRFVRLVEIITVANLEKVSAVATWAGAENKAAALDRQRQEHREGVVFKLRSAPHRAGGRNGQHKKFKFVKTLSAIAGKPRATGKDSVELFLYEGKKLIRVGTVSLIGKVKVNEWDVLEIAYLYAFRESKKLIQARLLRVRSSVAPKECTTAQLIFKREDGQ